jgi:hypothetical protein
MSLLHAAAKVSLLAQMLGVHGDGSNMQAHSIPVEFKGLQCAVASTSKSTAEALQGLGLHVSGLLRSATCECVTWQAVGACLCLPVWRVHCRSSFPKSWHCVIMTTGWQCARSPATFQGTQTLCKCHAHSLGAMCRVCPAVLRSACVNMERSSYGVEMASDRPDAENPAVQMASSSTEDPVPLRLPSAIDTCQRVLQILRVKEPGQRRNVLGSIGQQHTDDASLPDLDMLVLHLRAANFAHPTGELPIRDSCVQCLVRRLSHTQLPRFGTPGVVHARAAFCH